MDVAPAGYEDHASPVAHRERSPAGAAGRGRLGVATGRRAAKDRFEIVELVAEVAVEITTAAQVCWLVEVPVPAL